MPEGETGGDLGLSRLQRHNGHAPVERAGRNRAQEGRVAHAFEVDPDRVDLGIVEVRVDDVLDSEHRLVAHAHHRHDGHLALLEDQHLGERAALAHDGDSGAVAARHAIARPHVEAEPVVQHAVAVGPDDRHVPGGLHQAGLQSLALRALLREPGRVAHRAPRPALRELGQDIDAALRRHRDIGAVRPLRQLAHGGEHRVPVHLRTARMHVPHLAPEAEVGTVAQRRLRPRAPDERDAPGAQQALDVQPALRRPLRHSDPPSGPGTRGASVIIIGPAVPGFERRPRQAGAVAGRPGRGHNTPATFDDTGLESGLRRCARRSAALGQEPERATRREASCPRRKRDPGEAAVSRARPHW